MTIRRRIGGLLAATLLSALFVGITHEAPASAAPAAPSCTSEGCNYQDPHQTGCDRDGRALESFWRDNTFISLKYSPSCNAAWAYGYTLKSTYAPCNSWNDHDLLWIEGSSGGRIVAYTMNCLSSAPGNVVYTNMVSFNYWTRACLVKGRAADWSLTYNGCTSWR
ncbi:MAG TPA: DUF2690 domain-containing protein [Acidimicrobiales bacterium]|jgi:hypothetical protein